MFLTDYILFRKSVVGAKANNLRTGSVVLPPYEPLTNHALWVGSVLGCGIFRFLLHWWPHVQLYAVFLHPKVSHDIQLSPKKIISEFGAELLKL